MMSKNRQQVLEKSAINGTGIRVNFVFASRQLCQVVSCIPCRTLFIHMLLGSCRVREKVKYPQSLQPHFQRRLSVSYSSLNPSERRVRPALTGAIHYKQQGAQRQNSVHTALTREIVIYFVLVVHVLNRHECFRARPPLLEISRLYPLALAEQMSNTELCHRCS